MSTNEQVSGQRQLILGLLICVIAVNAVLTWMLATHFKAFEEFLNELALGKSMPAMPRLLCAAERNGMPKALLVISVVTAVWTWRLPVRSQVMRFANVAFTAFLAVGTILLLVVSLLGVFGGVAEASLQQRIREDGRTMPSSVPLTRGTPPAGQEPRLGSRSAHG